MAVLHIAADEVGCGGLIPAYLPAMEARPRTLDRMAAERVRTASIVVSAVIDVVVVLLFALIGRASHNEGALGLFGTAWPFLAGLALGWAVMRAWRHPHRIVWTGLGIWVATVVGGMLLRLASGQGTQFAFILVATAALGLLLIGWRALSLLVSRTHRQAAP